jgi:type VI secretion system protein ImpK
MGYSGAGTMNQDDPFGPLREDDDRTILKPAPGKRGISPRSSSPQTSIGEGSEPWPRLQLPASSSANPLLASASRLIALGVQLRSLHSPPDIDRLGADLVSLVREFEATAQKLGASQELIAAARYCLCTFLDETISTTPWGGGGQWHGKNLLVRFHNEAFGGEKFFLLLKRAREKPHETIDLLELMYVMLALGFVGRYAKRAQGELWDVREELYHTIRLTRGEPERALSQRWHPVKDKRPALVQWVPLWVVSAAAAAVLLGIYLLLAWSLNRQSYPVWEALHAIPAVPPVRAAPSIEPRLAVLLANDIRAGLVDVVDEANRSTATIPGDGLFESGSAAIKPQYEEVLLRIADAMNTLQGPIEVNGHTDDRPIATGRFRNNWQLSKARADAVVDLMGARLREPGRLTSKGHADKLPRVANDTAPHRALNRRVEITLFTQPHTQSPSK